MAVSMFGRAMKTRKAVLAFIPHHGYARYVIAIGIIIPVLPTLILRLLGGADFAPADCMIPSLLATAHDLENVSTADVGDVKLATGVFA